MASGEWVCTDIGTRVIVAVQKTADALQDPSWLNGPPYAVAEVVIDEDDFGGCFFSREEWQRNASGPVK